MKQITQPITDVDVELITFREENVYETFTNALQLDVQDIPSREEAIAMIQARHPIAFFQRDNNSFILITKKEESLVDTRQINGAAAR
ncbi:MAG TPA: hypothetical protein VIU13_02130 [Chryseolinea sp.]